MQLPKLEDLFPGVLISVTKISDQHKPVMKLAVIIEFLHTVQKTRSSFSLSATGFPCGQ